MSVVARSGHRWPALALAWAASCTRAEPPASPATSGEVVVGDGSSSSGAAWSAPDLGEGSSGAAPHRSLEPSCGEVTRSLVPIPPRVMLVLDESGSMVSRADVDGDGQADGFWDHDGDLATPDISRWASLHHVVEAVVTELDTRIEFGVALFPARSATDQYSTAACVVAASPEVEIGPDNAVDVLAGIPAADAEDLHGATPAARGIASAVAHLEAVDGLAQRFIVLVTDGAANCGAAHPNVPDALEMLDEGMRDVVADAYDNRGIPTFVVGIDVVDALTGVGPDGMPEANTHVELDALATVGGRPRTGPVGFYDASDETELADALAEIADDVLSCVVVLDPPPEDPDFVRVVVDGEPASRRDACSDGDGWVLATAPSGETILELCGATCERLGVDDRIDVTYGCPPQG